MFNARLVRLRFLFLKLCIRHLNFLSLQRVLSNILKLKVKCELFRLSGINDAVAATKRSLLHVSCDFLGLFISSYCVPRRLIAAYTRFDFAPNLCHLFFMERSKLLALC